MLRFRQAVAGAALVACIAAAQQSRAVTINLIDVNGHLTGTAAGQDLKIAADYWQSVLTSNVTVNLQVDYSALGTGVIASTNSRTATASVSSVYAALAASGNSALDATAVANLRPLDGNGGLSFIANATVSGAISSTSKTYDADGSANNTMLSVNTSVIKALGLGGYDTGYDGSIDFSSNFNFDYDPTDGIQSTKVDFLGVAIHEIGHALGFTSGVDNYDYYAQPQFSVDLNGSAEFSTLDLFRYSSDPNNLVPGTAPVLDLSSGTASYFSINGGTMFNGAKFSTGAYTGDGHQASHWKDSSGCGAQIGIMDPTFCKGQMGALTDDDLAAMDALGWNVGFDTLQNLGYAMTTDQIYRLMSTPVSDPPSPTAPGVPEPASWGLMLLGFALVGAAARQQRARDTVGA